MIIVLALIAAWAGMQVAPPAAEAAVQDPAAAMEALQQVYDESCGSRGYGDYDDVCNQITVQIQEARKDLLRQERAMKAALAHPRSAAPPEIKPNPAPLAGRAAPHPQGPDRAREPNAAPPSA